MKGLRSRNDKMINTDKIVSITTSPVDVQDMNDEQFCKFLSDVIARHMETEKRSARDKAISVYGQPFTD